MSNFGTMPGPFLGLALLPDHLELYIFMAKSTYHRVCHGPCWDHIWPSFGSKPARALIFSKLSQQDLKQVSRECPLFGTLSGPCLAHDGAISGLTFHPDQIEL